MLTQTKQGFNALIGRISTLSLDPVPQIEEIDHIYKALDGFTSEVLLDSEEWEGESQQVLEELLLKISTIKFVEFLEEGGFGSSEQSSHAFETAEAVRKNLLIRWELER